MKYEPEHLKLWSADTHAGAMDSSANYAGDDLSDYYCVVSKSRDSEILSEVNFDVALERLGGESDVREKCDACSGRGWRYNSYAQTSCAECCGTGKQTPVHGVLIAEFGHWACGWFKWILIHKNAPQELLEKADEILDDMDGYPVLDEDRYSNACYEALCDYWYGQSLKERMEDCKRAGASIFSARPSQPIPEDVYSSLQESFV